MKEYIRNFDISMGFLSYYLKNYKYRIPLGGIGEVDYERIINLVDGHVKDKLQICEIGSWTGTSSVLFAIYARATKGKVFCVDNFKGNSNLLASAKKHDIKAILEKHLKKFKVEEYVEVLKMDSSEASLKFKSNTLDVLFIDGEHSCPGVKKDIELYWPKLKVGGIMIGHDYFHSTVKEAILEIFPNHKHERYLKGKTESSIWYIEKRR